MFMRMGCTRLTPLSRVGGSKMAAWEMFPWTTALRFPPPTCTGPAGHGASDKQQSVSLGPKDMGSQEAAKNLKILQTSSPSHPLASWMAMNYVGSL